MFIGSRQVHQRLCLEGIDAPRNPLGTDWTTSSCEPFGMAENPTDHRVRVFLGYSFMTISGGRRALDHATRRHLGNPSAIYGIWGDDRIGATASIDKRCKMTRVTPSDV